jgi:hypothetical protein
LHTHDIIMICKASLGKFGHLADLSIFITKVTTFVWTVFHCFNHGVSTKKTRIFQSIQFIGRNTCEYSRTCSSQTLCEIMLWLSNQSLVANKLTLNVKKTNFIIFHPHQKKISYWPKLVIFDQNKCVALEYKEYTRSYYRKESAASPRLPSHST